MNEAGAESWSAREPARVQRGAALAGVNREGDGVAALVEVARVGAARRGVVAGEDAGAAAHARLAGRRRPAGLFRCGPICHALEHTKTPRKAQGPDPGRIPGQALQQAA